MTERTPHSDGCTDRRTLLKSLGTVAATATIPTAVGARAARNQTFVVEQGDRCAEIVPLRGDEAVEEFYGYRTPYTAPLGYTYSSHGTTDLQRNDASRLFLYDGTEGLSLVMLHDKLNGGSDGGSVTFEISGLPASGEWAIKDDSYDASTNYDSFDVDDPTVTIDWTWAADRSDGAAFRGIDGSTELTIDPAFNDASTIADAHYDGSITEWQVLSGDPANPDIVSLALDEPITIRAGTCDSSNEGGKNQQQQRNQKQQEQNNQQQEKQQKQNQNQQKQEKQQQKEQKKQRKEQKQKRKTEREEERREEKRKRTERNRDEGDESDDDDRERDDDDEDEREDDEREDDDDDERERDDDDDDEGGRGRGNGRGNGNGRGRGNGNGRGRGRGRGGE